jgi:hypothetical protein
MCLPKIYFEPSGFGASHKENVFKRKRKINATAKPLGFWC